MKPEPGTQREMTLIEAERLGFGWTTGYIVEVDADGGLWILMKQPDGSHQEVCGPGQLQSEALERLWE